MSNESASDLPGQSVCCSDTDRRIYEQELQDFLPAKIFDSHIHMFDRSCLVPSFEFPPQNVYQKFGGTFTIEQCQEWVQALLPQQEFHLTIPISMPRPFIRGASPTTAVSSAWP